jgi:hypothetical protein
MGIDGMAQLAMQMQAAQRTQAINLAVVRQQNDTAQALADVLAQSAPRGTPPAGRGTHLDLTA